MHRLRNGRNSLSTRWGTRAGASPVACITCRSDSEHKFPRLYTSYEIGIVGGRFVTTARIPYSPAPRVIRGFFLLQIRLLSLEMDRAPSEWSGRGKEEEKNFLLTALEKDAIHFRGSSNSSRRVESQVYLYYIRHTHLSVSSIPNNYFLSKRASPPTRSISSTWPCINCKVVLQDTISIYRYYDARKSWSKNEINTSLHVHRVISRQLNRRLKDPADPYSEKIVSESNVSFLRHALCRFQMKLKWKVSLL